MEDSIPSLPPIFLYGLFCISFGLICVQDVFGFIGKVRKDFLCILIYKYIYRERENIIIVSKFILVNGITKRNKHTHTHTEAKTYDIIENTSFHTAAPQKGKSIDSNEPRLSVDSKLRPAKIKFCSSTGSPWRTWRLVGDYKAKANHLGWG